MSLIGQRDCGLYGNILYLETIWIERYKNIDSEVIVEVSNEWRNHSVY